jgi:hypothetical protein
MPQLRVELPARLSRMDLEALQAELDPFGNVEECPPVSFGAAEVALAVSLFFEAVQGIDVLIRWLEAWLDHTPRAYEATIRLPDGRDFVLRTDNKKAFRKALKAAIQEL